MEAQQTITRQPQTTSLGRRFKKAVLIGFATFGFLIAALLVWGQFDGTHPSCTVTETIVFDAGNSTSICVDPTHRDYNVEIGRGG